MAGLLDFLSSPESQLGLGLLAAAGSGQRFGPGLLSAVQYSNEARQNDEDRKLQSQYRQAQITELMRKSVADQQKQNALMGLLGMGGAAQPTAPTASISGGSPTTPSQAQAGGVSGRSGGLGNATIDQIAAAKALGGIDLTDQWKLAQTGVPMDANKYYNRGGQLSYLPQMSEGVEIDPRTGRAQAVPGYAEAAASIQGAQTGAQEAAKYPFTVGADRARQTQQAALDPVSVIGEDGNTYLRPRLDVMAGGGGGGQMAKRNPVMEQNAMKINDNWITNTYQPTLDSASGARDMSNAISAIRNIDLKTGWGTEAKAAAAGVLSGLGIAPANAQMFAANSQKFQQVAMDRLQKNLMLQKGPQTEGDANRASKTFVSLANTPEANAFILDYAQAQANADLRKADFYREALPLAQQGQDLTRVDREWQKVSGSIWDDPLMQRWKLGR